MIARHLDVLATQPICSVTCYMSFASHILLGSDLSFFLQSCFIRGASRSLPCINKRTKKMKLQILYILLVVFTQFTQIYVLKLKHVFPLGLDE
jgi:hypothetical protein